MANTKSVLSFEEKLLLQKLQEMLRRPLNLLNITRDIALLDETRTLLERVQVREIAGALAASKILN
jgi:hypothetical protein